MKKFILATALVASILGAAVSAQANTYKYYQPGSNDIGTLFENIERGG